MPRKIFLLLVGFLLISGSLTHAAYVLAEDTPTPAGQPTCDLCGWCNQTVNPTPPSNWNQCRACLYDSSGNEARGSYYTILGCFSTKPESFVRSIMSIVFGIAGGIAFLSVLGGAATVLTSSGDPERLKNGKEMIFSSLMGILLILFSVFLLKVVGLDILGLPGFK